MTVNVENVQKLIDYYEAKPGVQDWSYGQCIAGVIEQMGIIDSIHNYATMCDFLGLKFTPGMSGGNEQLQLMIGGPSTVYIPSFYTFSSDGPTYRKGIVLNMLRHFQTTGDVVWVAPKN